MTLNEDRCAWFRCSGEVGIIYGAVFAKNGERLMIPLCDKHWGKIAGLGSIEAGKVLQHNVPNMRINIGRTE